MLLKMDSMPLEKGLPVHYKQFTLLGGKYLSHLISYICGDRPVASAGVLGR